MNEGLATPQLRDRLKELGGQPEPKTPQEFAAFIVSQYKRWGDVIRITGVTLD